MADHTHETTVLQHYLNVLRRRKWIVLQATLVCTLAVLLFSLKQEHLYRASADVLLRKTANVSAVTGVVDPNAYTSDERFSQTQSELARVPEVLVMAIKDAGIATRTPGELLQRSSVTPRPNSNLLEFTVTDAIPKDAARLATSYGRVFTEYRHELEVTTLRQARRAVENQIAQLKAAGQTKSALYIGLVGNAQQLRQIELLQGKHVLVRPASSAAQVQPRPIRYSLLGLVFGLGLGLGLAFLRDALDTRVRSGSEVSERLGLPLLARLPEPPTRLRNEHKLSMVEEPSGAQAEAFRVLRTNLEFVNLERGSKVIMITSAIEAEGKTTTVANLAVALARAGRRVVAIDLDLRRPMLNKVFGIHRRHAGLTQVALGALELEDALVRVPIVDMKPRGASQEEWAEVKAETREGWAPAEAGREAGDEWQSLDEAPSSNGSHEGSLQLLVSGPIPPDVGEFVGSRSLARILEGVRGLADIVLVDAPPLLRVGDAITLSGQVDSMVLVTSLAHIRRPLLNELNRVLENCPAEKLGFALTGANLEEGYDHSYGGYYYAPSLSRQRPERVR